MKILEGKLYEVLRENYIKLFIDTDNQYYINYILNKTFYSDGLCYKGYLWDVFKSSKIISYGDALKKILSEKELYILWDIHSKENIFAENYWKYPKESIILLEDNEFNVIMNSFPDDIYIFDTNFSWTIALTHEEIRGDRYCLYQEI